MNSRGTAEGRGIVVVIGMGEVGRPLFHILNKSYECVGVDMDPIVIQRPCEVLHVCYPYSIPDFIGTTLEYIGKYQPALTIIDSTVAPGTTRKMQQQAGPSLIAYSPVRGKHARMEPDLLKYKKFVAAPRPEALAMASDHFKSAGLRTDTFPTPELAELGKLLETSYLGVLVGWAQEMERLAAKHGGTFEDVNAFMQEIDFLPSHIFPGTIGGHCILPNIAILQSVTESPFLDAVVESNESKKLRYAAAAAR